MSSVDEQGAGAPTIQPCPCCHSTTCRSNKISNPSFGEAAGSAWEARNAGHNVQALRIMFAWACVEAANILRPRWSCDYCKHSW